MKNINIVLVRPSNPGIFSRLIMYKSCSETGNIRYRYSTSIIEIDSIMYLMKFGGVKKVRLKENDYISVLRIDVTDIQFSNIKFFLEEDSKRIIHYNFLGLCKRVIDPFSKGMKVRNSYFSSEYLTEILRKVNIDIFPNQNSQDILPYQFLKMANGKREFTGRQWERKK